MWWVAENKKPIIGNEIIIFEYPFYILSSPSFKKLGKERMSGAVGHKRVSKEFIKNFQIPLSPLTIQK